MGLPIVHSGVLQVRNLQMHKWHVALGVAELLGQGSDFSPAFLCGQLVGACSVPELGKVEACLL